MYKNEHMDISSADAQKLPPTEGGTLQTFNRREMPT